MRFPDFDDECRKLERMREKMDVDEFVERYKRVKYPNKNRVPDHVIKCYLELKPELIDIASRIALREDAVMDMFTHIDHCMGMFDEHGNLVDWAR